MPIEQSSTRTAFTTFTNTPIVVQPLSNVRQNVTQLQASNNYQPSRQVTTSSSTTSVPIFARTTDETFFDVPKTKQKVHTTKLKNAPVHVVPLTQSSTLAPPPPASQQPQFNFDSFQQNNFGAIPQRVIIPSQLSPEQRLALQASNKNFNGFQTTVTTSTSTQPPQSSSSSSSTTPVSSQQFNSRPNQVAGEQKSLSSPQKFNFKTQKYEFAEPRNPTTQFYNPKYETKGSDQQVNGNINLEPTKSNFVKYNNKTYAPRQTTTTITSSHVDENKQTTFNPQQYYYQSDQYQNLSPRGFSVVAQQQQQQQPQQQSQQLQQQRKTPAPEINPQITSRSESRNHKKFSTLVPKENYNNPTTFKPNSYSKKPLDTKIEKIQNPNKYYSQLITSAPTIYTTPTTQATTTTFVSNNNNNNHFHQTTTTIPRYSNFFSTSVTPKALTHGEEDDGQYRPDLYEKDFFRNRPKTTKLSSSPVKNTLYQFYQTSTAAPAPRAQNIQNNFNYQNNQNSQINQNHQNSNNNNQNDSGEEEFLKTEHSQNIFASGNQLRAEKEKEKLFGKNLEQFLSETSSPRPFSKPTPQATTTTITTTTTTTLKPSTTRKASTSSVTTKRIIPKGVEKDVSYDYQYYDTNGDHEYPDIEAIEDFGRTVKKSNTK